MSQDPVVVESPYRQNPTVSFPLGAWRSPRWLVRFVQAALLFVLPTSAFWIGAAWGAKPAVRLVASAPPKSSACADVLFPGGYEYDSDQHSQHPKALECPSPEQSMHVITYRQTGAVLCQCPGSKASW